MKYDLNRTSLLLLLRVLIVSGITFLLCYKQYQSKFDIFTLIDEIFFPFILLFKATALIMVLLLLSVDLKLYFRSKKHIYWTNFFIVVFGIISIFFIRSHIKNTFNKPTLILISFYQDFNGVEIDFKKDGTYIYNDICLGESFSFGDYEMYGDTFVLNNLKGIKDFKKTIRVLPKKEDEYKDIAAFEIQTDSNDKYLNSFYIREDNR